MLAEKNPAAVTTTTTATATIITQIPIALTNNRNILLLILTGTINRILMSPQETADNTNKCLPHVMELTMDTVTVEIFGITNTQELFGLSLQVVADAVVDQTTTVMIGGMTTPLAQVVTATMMTTTMMMTTVTAPITPVGKKSGALWVVQKTDTLSSPFLVRLLTTFHLKVITLEKNSVTKI